jgi:hypothetical protein
MFHDLPLGNAQDVEYGNSEALAGWWHAHKLALLGTVPGHLDDHLITFGDKIIDCGFEVRESAVKYGGELFDALRTRRYFGGEFFVLNEVGRNQLVDQTYVSLIEDFLDESAD